MVPEMIVMRRNGISIADFSGTLVREVQIRSENRRAKFRQTIIVGFMGGGVGAHTKP